MSARKKGVLSPQIRNGSKRNGKQVGTTSRQGKFRRVFSGVRDKFGRATRVDKKLAEPKKNKRREFPIPPPGYPFGLKPWLKRKEIWWEYGLCPRSIRRLEIRGFVRPHVLTGDYFYERTEIEGAIRGSRLLERPTDKPQDVVPNSVATFRETKPAWDNPKAVALAARLRKIGEATPEQIAAMPAPHFCCGKQKGGAE